MKKGIVFNIQRYSLHDGGGIRTIVFLKGCPLTCQWCSNPESQNIKSQNMYSAKDCISCKRCVTNTSFANCDVHSIDLENRIADNCPSEALQKVGQIMSVDDILNQVKRDAHFYDMSQGGVTLSGGEPFLQWAFVEELVTALKDKYYNVAIETTGYAKWKNISKSVEKIDTILYDIKHTDSEIHKKYTGINNELIIQNLEKCSKINNNIIIRIPLIHKVNDDDANIMKTCELAKKLKIKEIHILPYHALGIAKYKKINKQFGFNFERPSDERIFTVCDLIQSYDLHCKIGG